MGQGREDASDGWVGEKGRDEDVAHVFGMAVVVEENEAPDPVQVAILGAEGIVPEAYGVADLVEEALRLWIHP